jgi:tripartite-type tricarboxylate transporter receptor subunit TctC
MRLVAQKVAEDTKQTIVIENRPGAGGTLGAEAVARADKDGYTLGLLVNGHVISGVLSKAPRYDTATAFDAVGLVATASLMIAARPDFSANTIKDVIALAKAQPGKLSFGSPGFGGTQHFTGELFKQMAQLDMLHVPFRTSPELATAVMGKQVDLLFDTVPAVLGMVRSGQLKALAVTGDERFPAVPDVPTVKESGALPGYVVSTWYGLVAPRGTPPAVLAKLNNALRDTLADKDVRDKLAKAGAVAQHSTPEAFRQHIVEEVARWDKVREGAKIQKQ